MSTLNSEKSDNDPEMSCLSTPSKVALSLAQNPMRSITPGYMETDIKFLIESTSSTVSPDEEQVHFEFPQSIDRKREIYRQIAVAYAMMTLGLNDGAPGALLPSLERYYDLNYAIVSLIFLSTACGFILASFLAFQLHAILGRCKSLVIGTCLQASCYIVLSTHPPYPGVVFGFFLAGSGMGFMLAHCNAYMATRRNSIKVMGYMSSCYGIGATLAPIIATRIVSRGSVWSTYYFITLSLSLLCSVALGLAFRNEHRDSRPSDGSRRDTQRGKLGMAVKSKVTWIAAIFIFLYQGAEVALGGWLVTFMIQIRGGDPSTMGYTATGFWLGVTLGRIMMGHIPTGNLGQKRMVYIYLTLSLFLYLLFWLIPSIVSSSVSIALVGICLGPVYPCTMNVLAKLVGDRELLVAVVGIVGGVGNAGGAIAPFTTGLLAQRKGVSVLQPVILSLVASTIGTWWFLPNIPQGDA